MKVTKRLEMKYEISYVDYFKIIELIKATMIHDKHGDEDSYDVKSIYFDDLVHTGASDKAFGNEEHLKYRIRHYNDPGKLKLELKHKVGNESTKYSCIISKELSNALIIGDTNYLHQHFDNKLIRKFTLDYYRHYLKPILYINYKREAYKDDTDNLRITFDHSLSAERFLDDKIDMSYQLLSNTKLILEIKYEHFIPRVMKEMLKKISLNQIAVSKYFMGYNAIEL